ncbi:hypothetical protein FE249_20890 (plasmid) [Acidiphilium multivorum]|uniref:hypothetical protein n=1 Tax=Acidiphilium multivorum TaxID=62140 RepID=UPI001CDBB2F0|nr:hypothetical protein [Acidiphilium multivorum]UBU64056.1 hypothetical protein LDB30_15810 [Acidithiobacillus ferrooxidans]UNC16661.1 hypothetical protein FE249_20890 [Acidiphilium multivorum]
MVIGIEEFWRAKLAGSSVTTPSMLSGWVTGSDAVAGFVEPTLKVLDGDPATARIFLIAAPGAVGKSSYAGALAAATQAVVVDLARTAPLGGNFFTGGLSNAFGHLALADAAAGKIALIVDALDEAQMRAGSQGYEAGLADLAGITENADALPTVLLGRAIAAEDAYLYLGGLGYNACLLEIEFFSDNQARAYIDGKLALLASPDSQSGTAFASHTQTFRDLAHSARAKLSEAAGCDRSRFSGYAPVLDAICEFTLDPESLNPMAKLSDLNSTSPIELIYDIIKSILKREQGKLQAQFRERHPDAGIVLDGLYAPDEQLGYVAASLFSTPAPTPFSLSNSAHQVTYQEMVATFAPQHPFLSSPRAASNPVFAAYLVAWALKRSANASFVRKAVLKQPAIMSGIFFDLYEREMQRDANVLMPLADVGLLYQALNSQITPGQRVQLEIFERVEESGGGVVEIGFEILERSDPESGDALPGRTWGPYVADTGTVLELRSPFSNIYIDAPIMVELGDGVVQQIGAPTEISVEALIIGARQVLVVGVGPDVVKEQQTVSLIASDTDCEKVQTVDVSAVTLSVTWPGAEKHPWNRYSVDVVPAADENVDFMRRRLRNILIAFRSHSKGALRRLAAKIDHIRMIKDARGRALIEKLIADKILVLVLSGKFYELDPDVMGRILCVNYHELAKSQFSPELDSYLYDVLTMMPKP